MNYTIWLLKAGYCQILNKTDGLSFKKLTDLNRDSAPGINFSKMLKGDTKSRKEFF